MDPAAAVTRRRDVGRFAGVLLEVGPLDPDALAVGQVEVAVEVDRQLELADLIVLRLVGVEVVLPGEHRPLDRAVEGEAGPDRELHRRLVQHGQAPGKAERHCVHVRVRIVAELVGGGREELGLRQQLGVDLEADHDLPPVDRAHRSRPSGAWASSTAAARNIATSPSDGASSWTPTGQPVVTDTERHRHRRVAGKVRGDGADVVHVHRHRVVGLRAEGERRGGRGRRQQQVELLVGGVEVVGDQPSDLLGGAVVRVVVARRERVGAEHDAALHLVAEPGRPRGVVHLGRRRRVDPETEPHAVVARQVRAGLGRREDVVRREPVGRGGHRRLLHLRPGGGERVGRLAGPGRDVGRDALAEELGDDTDPQAVDAVAEMRRQRRHRLGDRGRVGRIVTGDRLEQQRGVGHVRGERSDLVERAGEGDQTVARHQAVRRLHADDATERGGLADRATGVGSERQRHEAGGDGGGRASRRAARHPRGVAWVAGRAEGGVLRRGTHGELVEVGLADHDRARPRPGAATTVAS